mmetsp:Transcript_22587/g.47356  ORF Transcript_22587/g.47356 Transcript_22587/m.47356 type:complete len:87 (-) Transcript_22587:1238-1498(-)
MMTVQQHIVFFVQKTLMTNVTSFILIDMSMILNVKFEEISSIKNSQPITPPSCLKSGLQKYLKKNKAQKSTIKCARQLLQVRIVNP